MTYRCLVLDHDDTVVNSTATIHYPAFVAFMEQLRGGTSLTLEEYFVYNFDPGVLPFFRDIVGLSDEEMVAEEAFWREYVKHHIPKAYPGMKELLWDYKNAGGILCVTSHSFGDYIRRDYAANGLPEPDLIFGWEVPKEIRKPEPHSLFEIEKRFGLQPEQLIVLDDLKPGYDMAKAAGVPFAAAGWAGDYPAIERFMRGNCDIYCKTIEEFRRLVL
ncbi:MAG: HAD family phosphatase [Lachnospiraceae bacterium]|nr:HAD family phosphatase [Lachnospiraceae bacterium]